MDKASQLITGQYDAAVHSSVCERVIARVCDDLKHGTRSRKWHAYIHTSEFRPLVRHFMQTQRLPPAGLMEEPASPIILNTPGGECIIHKAHVTELQVIALVDD